ncbi:MAG: hypothetical protein HQL46_08335 [Gammaproteobacteria bacterium]|nr:hypothetical protein [Gammaproteobacteria bacterium]
MGIFKVIPFFSYLLLANLTIFLLKGNNAPDLLNAIIFQMSLFSGATFNLSVNGLFLILGAVFLFIEIIKSTRTNNASIIDHMLSSLVFIGFLVVFIVMPGAASETYFVLMLMSLIDFIAGFTITITSARKDFSLSNEL